MLAQCQPVTFILTRDRTKTKAFYGDLLGLPLRHEDDQALVYDLNGVPLRITTKIDHKPGPQTVLGWNVSDIVAIVTALRAKGVEFQTYGGFEQDELGIWNVPGGDARVAWFHDPDGNNLSLTQF